jgi:fluoride exporter
VVDGFYLYSGRSFFVALPYHRGIIMARILAIASAGAVGSLARYWLSALVQRWTGSPFPWGTFAVNIMGSFLFGLIWTLAEERLVISSETRIILLTGFMGAFTTFSTFAFETGIYVRDSRWPMVFANIAAQIVIGIAAMLIGMGVGRQF